jgi:phosphate uptake regulator
MEIRKIQKTGGSSYIVSLPKSWAEEMGIKEQDKVGLLPRADGTMVIIPRIDQQVGQRENTIDVDSIDHGPLLFRLLVGAYIVGYNKIHVQSKERLDSTVKATARQFINKAIGLEITSETASSLTIKDLLNPAEMKFKVWIERMSQLVVTRLEEAVRSLIEADATSAKEVIDGDVDINRLHWIISRQHNILLRNLAYSEMLGPAERRGANYSLIARIMERIGDYAVKISENALHLAGKNLDKDLMGKIAKAAKLAISLFKRSIETFYSGDINDANQIIESIKDLVSSCEAIETHVLEQETVVGVSLGYINEAIRRTGENSGDMCEYIINFLIDQPPKEKK